MDADLRDRIIGPVGAWLRGRGGAGRDPEAGVGRPGGLLAAALTAAVVFFIGQQVIPRHVPTPLPPPPAVPATTPLPALPAPGPTADATALPSTDGQAAMVTDAAPRPDAPAARLGAAPAGDAAAPPPKAALPHEDAVPPVGPHADRKPSASDERTPLAPASATTSAAAPDKNAEKQSDKDLAREAWRRNLPDVSVDGQRVALLVPLKGSTAGASFHVTNRPHAVIVKLPKAASMITMRLYRIEHDGFRLLRINQAEKDAKAEDGTELKISLGDSGVVPQVEIRDDFVRVTVRRPSESSSAAAPPNPDAASE